MNHHVFLLQFHILQFYSVKCFSREFFPNVTRNYLNICHFSIVCASESVSLILRRRRSRGVTNAIVSDCQSEFHRIMVIADTMDIPISSCSSKKKRKTVQQLQRNLANLISTRWSLSQQFARVKALKGARGDHKGGPQTASLTSL